MIIDGTKIKAAIGKTLLCKWNNINYGHEVSLGYIYYRNGTRLHEPYLLTVDDFEEVEDHFLASITHRSLGLQKGCSYADIKTAVVKMRYSLDKQMAIILNHAEDPERYKTDYQEMQDWRKMAALVAERLSRKEDVDDTL